MKNEIIIDGRVTKQGVRVNSNFLSFSIGTLTSSKKIGEKWENNYTYSPISYYNKDGIPKAIMDNVKAGAFVRIYGKLDTNSYVGKDGEKKYNRYIYANNISLIEFVEGQNGKKEPKERAL